jgi:hypothetical protein
MGLITILCPRTGQQVPTGLETDPATFDAIEEVRARVTCWACGGEHMWSKRWASFLAEDTSDERHGRWSRRYERV